MGLKVTWVGVIINIFLVIIKIMAGVYGRSHALVADGVHSLSDLFTDVVVLFGLKWGRKEEDEEHPYGHARIETISGMLIGIVLFVVGLGLTYNAVFSIYIHQESHPRLITIIVASVSILLKEWIFRYTRNVGERIRSLVVIGNAWHHRSDALTSVAVLIGVTGAYLNPSWYLADSFAALIVTYFIVKVGVQLMWKAMTEVIDTAPDKKVLQQLAYTSSTIEGVREVHDMRARHSGAQIFVEMHIVVDPNLTVYEGHKIAAAVKYRLLNEVTDVARVIIHVDPELKNKD
ncbi:MAG: cation transporter [FCB group bacterium]|nr:cation transporter [FCB group bacterium]